MKTMIFAILVAVAVVGTGCYGTVSGRTKAGVPFGKDYVEGRYERSVEQVFTAAKEVVKFNGTLINEMTLHNQSNATHVVEGKVNQQNVYMRIQALEPKVTGIVVQARTKAGGADINLAHELEKQVAVKLAQ